MAVYFALSIVPLVMMVGSAIDYSEAISAKGRLQKAVDAAALAAATKPALTQPERQVIVNDIALANLEPALNATIEESEPSGNYQVKASANVAAPMTFFGTLTTMPVSATATATATASNTAGALQYAGNGPVAGDPHIAGADGSSGYLACGTPTGSWYNLLSDSGIEVNVSCVNNTGDNMDLIQSFSILLGTHVISLYAPQPTFDSNGNASYDASTAWFGQITIDGVTYPPVLGTHSYLNGLIKTQIADLADFYVLANGDSNGNQVHSRYGNLQHLYKLRRGLAMGDIRHYRCRRREMRCAGRLLGRHARRARQLQRHRFRRLRSDRNCASVRLDDLSRDDLRASHPVGA